MIEPNTETIEEAETMKSKQTPINATFDELCQMHRDNLDYKGFWCLTDGHQITICEQAMGESPQQKINIPVEVMRRFVKFLTTPQPIRETEAQTHPTR